MKSAFLLYRNRAERQTDVLAGERIDVLRRAATSAGWQITRRVIHLDQTVLLANNLSGFFQRCNSRNRCIRDGVYPCMFPRRSAGWRRSQD